MTQPTSEEIIKQVRAEIGPRSILSFSTGKDAIASHLAIRDSFDEVVPYFLYLVPGLEFIEDSLNYYERHLFNRKIIRLPHPTLYRWLNGYQYQTLSNANVISAAKLPEFNYLTVHEMVCELEDLDKNILIASGIRAADSPMRRVSLMTHGAISRNQKQYYPIWDWKKDRLINEISRAGLKLPIDYKLFGRSFDGLDARFLVPIKKQLPNDYKKILEFFPLADLEVWRYEHFGEIAI